MLPTLDNITYPNPSSPKHTDNDNIVNADRSLTIKWGGNKPVNDGKTSSRASGGKSKTTSDRHKIVTTVNGSHWAVTVQATISDLSTIRTNATNWATVVSGDSGVTYTIKVSNSDPTSWTASNIITLVP